jgi:hypothetical protein
MKLALNSIPENRSQGAGPNPVVSGDNFFILMGVSSRMSVLVISNIYHRVLVRRAPSVHSDESKSIRNKLLY